MARVEFTANIQRHTPCPPATLAGATVREVLESYFRDQPTARGYVLDEHGNLRKHMTVFVDGRMIRDRSALSDAVGSDSEIYVMQAISGG